MRKSTAQKRGILTEHTPYLNFICNETGRRLVHLSQRVSVFHFSLNHKEKFSDDELYYFLDLIDEYYSESGILDAQPDEDGYVNIDLEEVVAYIVKEAKKDEIGEYDPEEVLFVVQGEMEYGNSLGQVD